MTGNTEKREIVIIGSPPSTLRPSIIHSVGTDGIYMQVEVSLDAHQPIS